MKLQAEVNDEIHDIDIRREGGQVFARVDGREYELEVSEPEGGVFLFKNNGRITEVFVSPQNDAGAPVQVHTGGSSIDVRIIDPKRLRGVAGAGDSGDGAAEVRTAMPGKVVRILLEPGAVVSKGDGVLVVEAMKMQNELKAPKAGVIKEIRASEGATVAAGDVLAVIE